MSELHEPPYVDENGCKTWYETPFKYVCEECEKHFRTIREAALCCNVEVTE